MPRPFPLPISIGTDLCSVHRIFKIIRDGGKKSDLFLKRLLTDKEREELRKELKERFTPGARPMPTSFRGLASLANERIEDAIARGQFKVC